METLLFFIKSIDNCGGQYDRTIGLFPSIDSQFIVLLYAKGINIACNKNEKRIVMKNKARLNLLVNMEKSPWLDTVYMA